MLRRATGVNFDTDSPIQFTSLIGLMSMNNCTKTALLTIALGSVFGAANAEVVVYQSGANAPARCQAFTPGPSNTIRNRVVGSENVGTAPIAVACAFEVESAETSSNAIATQMFFSKNSAGTATVNCTLLTGWQGADGSVLVNKTVDVTQGQDDQSEIFYTGDDLPTPETDLGFTIVGVNCTVPQGVVINDTYVYWADENGV